MTVNDHNWPVDLNRDGAVRNSWIRVVLVMQTNQRDSWGKIRELAVREGSQGHRALGRGEKINRASENVKKSFYSGHSIIAFAIERTPPCVRNIRSFEHEQRGCTVRAGM